MDWESLGNLMDRFDSVLHENDGIGGALTFFIPGHTWADKWRMAKEIQEGFNSKVRYPTKAKRDEAWQRFNSLRGELARRNQQDTDSQKSTSGIHKAAILYKVSRTRPSSGILGTVTVQLLKELGVALNEASEMLTANKQEMLGEDKQECFEAIREMRAEHTIWWESLRAEGDKRRDDFKARTKYNLDQNYERLRKAKDALERCRNHADKLRDEISTAWNEEWRERREGWLAEAEDKISDIEQSIQRIETWIEQDEEKMR